MWVTKPPFSVVNSFFLWHTFLTPFVYGIFWVWHYLLEKNSLHRSLDGWHTINFYASVKQRSGNLVLYMNLLQSAKSRKNLWSEMWPFPSVGHQDVFSPWWVSSSQGLSYQECQFSQFIWIYSIRWCQWIWKTGGHLRSHAPFIGF